MAGFLRWAKGIGMGVLNGVARFLAFVVLLVIALVVWALFTGDGLPRNIVLAMDLRDPMADSSNVDPLFSGNKPTVMDIVLTLDAAERDDRVKGAVIRIGAANLSIAQAEELDAAIRKFRKAGKFVIAHSQGFLASGLGDYLTVASADQIWMQPKAPFTANGEGGGELFLRGLLDKINADPQIVKRADYKSAADEFMEKNMTPADREQLTRLMQSWYDAATSGAAAARHLTHERIVAAFEASPQFTENAQAAGLIDKIGYDDDAQQAALARAGDGAKLVKMSEYVRVKKQASQIGFGPKIALIQASGEIQDGTAGGGGLFGGNDFIAGDDLSRAIRAAAADKDVKAIILRVDSPGGSVTASDQILAAVKKAQAAGKPVVVSMGGVAASGGYYISLSANRIVAEPGTITGSIGVLTGKVSIDRSAALIGVGVDTVGVGRNALYNSEFVPYTPEQLAALNHEADAIYADFTGKVAAGRHMPIAKVLEIAKGRVWSGADARGHGLVDALGGFWTAADLAKKLANIGPDEKVVYKFFPKQRGFFETLGDALGGNDEAVQAVQGFITLMNAAPVRAFTGAVADLPRGGVEMRATGLPR
ncbi:MAG: signal peptide peptidase SppA [Alphaproteobacteria bacterium]|nr:signal peptide peptidase SppA [Alphaproteobacteria bacterium]MBL6937930.1 signal peptide peptidase SppA [Alphaproteobacteria bacterium]MBL7099245.1 signal peptide peptidase SppA [Alphaproteobacteria bacterium]